MRPGRPFYCALLLDSELDPNLNCFWPPPRGLEPDQPWASFLTWKTLLDSIFSTPIVLENDPAQHNGERGCRNKINQNNCKEECDHVSNYVSYHVA
jgi:hypothetical protein